MLPSFVEAFTYDKILVALRCFQSSVSTDHKIDGIEITDLTWSLVAPYGGRNTVGF